MLDMPGVYIFVGLISAFALILIGLTVSHIKLYRKYLEEIKSKNESKENLNDNISSEFEAESRNYFQSLKARYDRLFAGIEATSQDMLKQAQGFDQKERDVLQSSIEKATNAYSQAFATKLQTSESNLINVFQKASESIQSSTTEMLSHLKADQEKRISSLDGEFDKLIATFSEKLDALVRGELENAKKASETYVEKKMKIAEDKINMVVNDIASQVIERDISADDHRELIKKALNEAKEDGLFD